MKKDNPIYLSDIPFEKAISTWENALKAVGKYQILGVETILVNEHALNRVLAEPVWAKISSPHYYSAAMDGFAVLADQTYYATPGSPVMLKCRNWDAKSRSEYLDTGDPLPEWANAVVPIELVESFDGDLLLDEKGDHTHETHRAKNPRKPDGILIRQPVHPWEHVRSLGEDIVATQLVLPEGSSLRAVDIGAIAASGNDRIQVRQQPIVAVIPTGSELVPPGTPLREGNIPEYNSLILAAQVNGWGGIAVRYPITPDRYESIRQVLIEAAQNSDLILINAGSSAGSEDFSARVIADLGEVFVHGIAIRPGHPVILGMVDRNVPVIGVPGYPVSATLTGEIFVQPLIDRWLDKDLKKPDIISASISKKISSPAGDDEYLRVVVGNVGGRVMAAPLARGAGMITSLVKADGIVVIPRGVQGLLPGENVDVQIYRDLEDIEKNILITGSHDISLDLLAQFLSRRSRNLVSANVGSIGGLIALGRRETHLAGSHLLDPATGSYNISYIKKYLPGVPIKVISFVDRVQGLIVARNNPKNIQSLSDLTKPEIKFVNRQRGAGTRILLDYHLERFRIKPDYIRDYEHEEFTHLSVAAAVSSGRADCGLGIAAAAEALELDFVPLFEEQYELIVPDIVYQDDFIQPLFSVLRDQEFHRAVSTLSGYKVKNMGKIIYET